MDAIKALRQHKSGQRMSAPPERKSRPAVTGGSDHVRHGDHQKQYGYSAIKSISDRFSSIYSLGKGTWNIKRWYCQPWEPQPLICIADIGADSNQVAIFIWKECGFIEPLGTAHRFIANRIAHDIAAIVSGAQVADGRENGGLSWVPKFADEVR